MAEYKDIFGIGAEPVKKEAEDGKDEKPDALALFGVTKKEE